MRRKALIIGNAGNKDEFLLGVSKDVNNYKNFLLSNQGGDWYEHEIILSLNDTKEEVENKIKTLKNDSSDFSFVVFTGHGSYSQLRQCRKLYINDDSIYENDLIYSTEKQITILDTCAGIENDIITESTLSTQSMDSFMNKSNINYRKTYEHAILQCMNQQIILYACDIDESSADTSKGGLFSYYLINTAYKNKLSEIFNSQEAYIKTDLLVQNDARTKQNPQYFNNNKFGKILPFAVRG